MGYPADVRLADILSVERIRIGLQAEDKVSAVRQVAGLFLEDVQGVTLDEVVTVLEQREALSSTGAGSGVAFPHGRLEAVPSLLAAVAVAPEGVEFEAIDGRPVRIFVALLGPRNLDHLKALARFSRILRSERVREQLLGCRTAEEVLEHICAADRG